MGLKARVTIVGTNRSVEAIIINTIGANIKQLRKIHNLNQTDFANKIGVSQGSLSDLEFGKSKPAIETVISICSVFRCSYEWFFTGREHSNIGDLNNTISELVQVIKELSHSEQHELLTVATPT
ncbi:helix-turn-helix domain-containing protein [Paenibacillus phytohabitans]|uniref:helix-turn-helix domain-containing protein n=1 Tax=Paenibacillus phytohabitans TaxID=2654978 RepID=UPI00149100EA|nr:helix-turn-helix transcriptional regulator [Paenibacillus phytohabitans]